MSLGIRAAAQELLDALDRGAVASDLDTAWTKVYEAADVLRAALAALLEPLTEDERDKAERKLDLLRKAIQTHLDTFGYDNHEGLADALVAIEGGEHQ